jgi:hypothetical protein
MEPQFEGHPSYSLEYLYQALGTKLAGAAHDLPDRAVTIRFRSGHGWAGAHRRQALNRAIA